MANNVEQALREMTHLYFPEAPNYPISDTIIINGRTILYYKYVIRVWYIYSSGYYK